MATRQRSRNVGRDWYRESAKNLTSGLSAPCTVSASTPIRELRYLTRHRKSLLQKRTREVNFLHKVVEDAGVKLAAVATDVLGGSAPWLKRWPMARRTPRSWRDWPGPGCGRSFRPCAQRHRPRRMCQCFED